MKDHKGDIRSYIHVSRAWYASTALQCERYVDEVQFGFYSLDGGTSGEMGVRWYSLDQRLCPRLECFDDAWHTLAQFKDVIDAMGEVDGANITPDAFCLLLEQRGFVDKTDTGNGSRGAVVVDSVLVAEESMQIEQGAQ